MPNKSDDVDSEEEDVVVNDVKNKNNFNEKNAMLNLMKNKEQEKREEREKQQEKKKEKKDIILDISKTEKMLEEIKEFCKTNEMDLKNILTNEWKIFLKTLINNESIRKKQLQEITIIQELYRILIYSSHLLSNKDEKDKFDNDPHLQDFKKILLDN